VSDASVFGSLKTVKASLCYALAREEPLFFYNDPPPPGQPETNITFVEHEVAICDVRESESSLQLDLHGAAIYRHRSVVRDFYDDDEVRRVGYAEAANIVLKLTGAAEVVVFDHNVRRSGRATAPAHASAQKPVLRAHTDFTAASAPRRAASVLGQTGPIGKRVAAVNVWRPIAEPVRDRPLALCDASSVSVADLLPAALLYSGRRGEIYYVRHNDAHRWLYLSEMRCDEVWVFKSYDSVADGRARFTPHAAFVDASQESALRRRESVEFRAFALFRT